MRKLLILISFFGALAGIQSLAKAQDSLTTKLNRQIGIDAASFLFFLEESTNAFDINLRLRKKKHAWRTGLNYYHLTSDDGRLNIEAKFGYDRMLFDYDRWKVYAGVDFVAGYDSFKSNGRGNYRIGTAPFLGIMFYIGEHFAISTEPNLFFNYRWYKDKKTLSTEDIAQWYEGGLGNIGHLQFNVFF